MDGIAKKICIIKPSSLGDIIHALPALDALRKKFPDSWITWVVKEEYEELLLGHPFLNEVITVKKGFTGWLSAAQKLRKRGFDIAIDFQGLLRSACLAWWSGALERIGFSAAREGGAWFYTSRVPISGGEEKPWRLLDVHAVDRNLALARYLGAEPERVSFDLPPFSDDRKSTARMLEEGGISSGDRVVVIAPGGRLPIKRWPVERFAKVAQLLHQMEGVKIVIVGASSDIEIGAPIQSLLGNDCVNLIGKTRIGQLVAVIDRADILLANDSAPIHLAVACQTPVLAIMGPTNMKATGPYPSGRERVLHHNLPCSPCGKRDCSNPHYIECLTSIPVEDVLRVAQNMLLKTSSKYKFADVSAESR